MIQFIMLNWNEILLGITTIISGASILTALTPSTKDDKCMLYIKQILDVLAFNIGNAKKA